MYRKDRRRYDSCTLDDIKFWIESLLRRGREGGIVIITDIPSGKFVQFKKYIRRKGDYGLRMDFPKAPWSLPHYDAIGNALHRNAISFSIEPTDDEPVTEFLWVDFHQDTTLAMTAVKVILFDVFGLPHDRRFRLQGEDFSYKDELIDSPSDQRDRMH